MCKIINPTIIFLPKTPLGLHVVGGALPLHGREEALRQRPGDDHVKLAVVDHDPINILNNIKNSLTLIPKIFLLVSSVQNLLDPGLDALHDIRQQMLLNRDAVVVRPVADVERLAGGGQLQISGVVPEGGGGLGGHVVEVIVEAGGVGEVGRVSAQVPVEEVVKHLEGGHPLLLVDQVNLHLCNLLARTRTVSKTSVVTLAPTSHRSITMPQNNHVSHRFSIPA